MVLDFNNNRAAIRFEPEEGVNAEHYRIKIYARDATGRGYIRHVYTTREHRLQTGENIWNINISYISYNTIANRIKDREQQFLPNIIELSFKTLIDEEESAIDDVLTVHFVRYVPELLRTRGFVNGETLQNVWFTRGNNINRNLVDPELEIIDWNWVMSESNEARSEYEEFLQDTVSKLRRIGTGRGVKTSLRQEIRKMISDGLCSLPTSSNPRVNFGTFANDIENVNTQDGMERMPLFEKYYFNSKSFDGVFDLGFHYLNDGVDDLVSTLANFNFHVAARGQLIYQRNRVKIKISELAFYAKDSFDYIDREGLPSQNLGYWKIDNNQTVTVRIRYPEPTYDSEGNYYYYITNRDFRDYRNDCNMGYNYLLYSTLNIQDVDIELTL